MLTTYLGHYILVHLSEMIERQGFLLDAGSDCIILSEKGHNHYIPVRHIQEILLDGQDEDPRLECNGKTSFRKSLMSAKGRNVHVILGGNTVLYGYIMSIMNNYFVFYSPIYKTIFISMDHVKSMTFNDMDAPYGQVKRAFQPSKLALSRTFEEQIQKLNGQLVVFNLGDIPQKSGTLLGVEDGLVGLIPAHGNETYLSIRHIRSFYIP